MNYRTIYERVLQILHTATPAPYRARRSGEEGGIEKVVRNLHIKKFDLCKLCLKFNDMISFPVFSSSLISCLVPFSLFVRVPATEN